MSTQLDIFIDGTVPADVSVTPVAEEMPDCYVGMFPVRIPVIIAANRHTPELVKKCVDKVFHETHDPRVFSQCCQVWLAAVEGDEARYLELINGWSSEALQAATKGLSHLQEHFVYDGGFDDVLGQTYMMVRSDWGGKYLGQYFTPWPVCMLMAATTAGDLDEKRLLHGPPISVLDPACGSGAMLLAMQAHVASTHGRRALRNLRCYGQDVDATCVTMSKLQLRLTNVPWMLNRIVSATCETRGQIS